MKKLACVLAVAGLTLVAGCAQDPHVAARVDGSAISVNDVDILSNALCVEHSSAGAGTATTTLSQVRGSALAALIDTKVDAAVATQRHLPYSATQLGSSVQQLEPLIGKLPASQQDRARTLITDLLQGQMQMSTAAAAAIQASGKTPTQALVTTTVQQLEGQAAATMKIEVNPEFTSPGLGNAADGSQSVSVAVSPTAQDALKAFTGVPSASYVSSLPAAQTCE